jgi:type II secretory pathway pseudopilin PulG
MRFPLRRAFSLVEILVVVVILMIVAAFLLPKYLKGGKTTAGKVQESPKQRAKLVDCANNLNQIRMAYQMAASASEDETRPQSLADLKRYGLSDAMLQCPVSKVPYQYNPATGEVKCSHPGH